MGVAKEFLDAISREEFNFSHDVHGYHPQYLRRNRAPFIAFGPCIIMGLPFALYFLSRSAPPASGGSAEVGWDLVTMAHNSPTSAVRILLLVFANGFT